MLLGLIRLKYGSKYIGPNEPFNTPIESIFLALVDCMLIFRDVFLSSLVSKLGAILKYSALELKGVDCVYTP